MNIKSIRSVAETYYKMASGIKEDDDTSTHDIELTPDKDNLAAQDADSAQKQQDPQPEIPSWVPGNLDDEDKKEFAEAAKKAWATENNTFDFKGRTYKITEKLVGNQDKLDVNNNGKIDAEDLERLRSGEKPNVNEEASTKDEHLAQMKIHLGHAVKHDELHAKAYNNGEDSKAETHAQRSLAHANIMQYHADAAKKLGATDAELSAHGHPYYAESMKEHHLENEVETPGQTQYPGSNIKDVNGNGIIDGDDKAEMPGGDEEETDDVNEGAENPTDKLTLDVPAMIRALEKAREDFKSDEDIHNFVQGLLNKKDQTIQTNDLATESVAEDASSSANQWENDHAHSTAASWSMHARHEPTFANHSRAAEAHKIAAAKYAAKNNKEMEQHHSSSSSYHAAKAAEIMDRGLQKEALDPKADAGVWIKDFQDSDDPKFAGKSKEERKQQALAAWYSARREAGINEASGWDKPAGERPAYFKAAADSATKNANWHSERTSKDDNPINHGLASYSHAWAATQHANAHSVVTDPAEKEHHAKAEKYHRDMFIAHSNSAEKSKPVNEGAPADAKGGPEVMDPLTQATKDDHDDETKVEEAPYTNKADGSENIVPADKPAPKPTPTPKLTQKESTTMTDPIKSMRNVAEAYVEMVNEKVDRYFKSVAHHHGFTEKGTGKYRGSYIHPHTGESLTPLPNDTFHHEDKDGRVIVMYHPVTKMQAHLNSRGYKTPGVNTTEGYEAMVNETAKVEMVKKMATTAGSKVQAAHAAADAAWEATNKAEKSGSEEDHMNAFKAHAHAIEKHNEAGRHDTAELHQNKAEYHRGFTSE